MEMHRVQSTNLDAVGYDAGTQTLRVRFLDAEGTAPGQTYEYSGVPAAKHAGLMAARSKGGYFHQHIRPHYTGIRIAREKRK